MQALINYWQIKMINKKNISLALYSLSRVPNYAMTIIATLGITLGVLIAMFNLNYYLFMAPLPYKDADKLMVISSGLHKDGTVLRAGWSPVQSYIEAYNKAFDGIETKALHHISIDVEQSLPSHPSFNISAITPEYIDIIDAPLAIGRHLTAAEGLNKNSPVAVISYDVWQTYYQGSQDVLNQSLVFKGVSFKIVGVTAERFIEPSLASPTWHTDVWIPYDYNDYAARTWVNHTLQLRLVLKLSDIMQKQTVELALNNWVNERFKDETQGQARFKDTRLAWQLKSYHSVIIGNSTTTGLMMLAGSIVLLLIAIANISNLVLSRTVNQQRDFAIRIAMGAQPKHLFNYVLTELSMLFVGAIVVAGLVMLSILSVLKSGYAGPLARLDELGFDFATIIFAIGITILLNCALAGFVSKKLDYRTLNNALQSSGKGASVQISSSTRKVLVAIQVFFCLSLLYACLLVFKHSWQQWHKDTGLKSDNTYQVALNLGTLLETQTREQRSALLLSLVEDISQQAEIKDVGIGGYAPINYWLAGHANQQVQLIPGISDNLYTVQSHVGTSSFFNIFGLKLLEGRTFTQQESIEDSAVLLINETLAAQVAPNGSAIGKQIYRQGRDRALTVIGIVKDLDLPNKSKVGRIYMPTIPTSYPFLMIETKANAALDPLMLNRLFDGIHLQIKVYNFKSTKQLLDEHTQNFKVASIFTLISSITALFLAGIGIYGVFSYNVALQRFEFGVRMAIGATPWTIVCATLKGNLLPYIIASILASLVLLTFIITQGFTSYSFDVTYDIWLVPQLITLVLMTIITLLCVKNIVSKPAVNALRGQ